MVVWYLDLNLLKGARAHYQYSAISQSESGPQVHKSSQCHSQKSEEHKLPVGKSQRPHEKERGVFFLKINCQFKLENNYPSLGKRCCLDAFLRKGVGEMYPGFRGDAKEEVGFYIRIFCYQMYAIWANAK